MILFNDKYELELNVSHEDFIDGLLKKTEIRKNLNNDIFPNKKKDFLGQIEYNNFSIVFNKSSFRKNTFKITGKIIDIGDKIRIEGSIKGYKFSLLFILAFSLFSFGGMIGNLFIITGHNYLKIFFSVLTLIGVSNIFGLLNGLKKYKKQFLEKIKNIN